MKAKTSSVSSRSKTADVSKDEAAIINVEQLIRQAKNDAAWKSEKLYSKTLLKDAELRIVLIGIHEGSAIEMHEADSTVCLQVLEGILIYATEQKTLPVNEGEMFIVEKGTLHGLSAKIPTLFLMTKAV